MFQYAYARAYAEKEGFDLSTNRWVGEQIFDLPNHDHNLELGPNLPTDYHQDQASLIYTRKQVKEWFRFKPEIVERLEAVDWKWIPKILCHKRTEDYKALGYVVVSDDSYRQALLKYGYDPIFALVIESHGFYIEPEFSDELRFLPDFYRMVKTEVLFRGNSTFSWWAATLGDAKVYSPVIEGLEGGKEQNCKFVEGNWPRFANLPFTTDLHLDEG